MTQLNLSKRHGQQGFATILIVLLVGLALAASMLGTAYYVRSTQNNLIADHALTNVQSGVWTGVEATRQYLQTLDKDQLVLLEQKTLTLTRSNTTTGSLSNGGWMVAYINQVTAPTGTDTVYQVTVTIANKSNASRASSKVQVIYNVDYGNSTGTNTTNPPSSGTTVANIYSDFDASGGINITQNGTNTSVINVDGNFKTGGVSLTGIQTLNVTGNVTLTSATQIPYVYANGYIELQGSAAITQTGSAKGYITNNAWGTNGDFYADGIIVNNGGYIRNLNTKTNINLNNWSTINTAIANGSISCVSSGWNNFTSLAASSFSNCQKSSKVITNTNLSATGALATVSMTNKPVINALSYEASANYIFSVDSSNNIKVKVQNVSGITAGEYYLAKNPSDPYQGQSQVYLCASGNSCSNPVGKVADPYWGYNPISYSSGTWSLSDTRGVSPAIAPGIILFQGNVSMTLGAHYINAILATGNISYGGSVILYSPNYAGAAAVCNTQYAMPTNLCSSSSTLIPLGLGNIALLSGSCTDPTSVDTCSANYTGGNITLGASAKVYGNVIAGNLFNTSGSTTIVGGITATALNNSSKQSSKVGGSTNIDLTGLNNHTDFTPGTSPPEGNTSNNNNTPIATMKWARYL